MTKGATRNILILSKAYKNTTESREIRRLAEVPPTAYPTQIAVARVRVGGGKIRVGGGICMKQGPDDRHAVA